MHSPYEAFLQIVESGSISKACAELNISQPALSKQLRRLEDELKVELFERSPNGVRLTPYGKALVEPARVMRNADHAARMLVERLRRSVSGNVAFGVGPPLALDITTRAALDLLAVAPGLEITAVENSPEALLAMVRRNEIDFAVCGLDTECDEDLTVLDSLEDMVFVLASPAHALFDGRTLEPASLLDHEWVGVRHSVEARLARNFQSLGLPLPRMRIETSSVAQTISLLESGGFIGLLPTIAVRAQLAGGSLRPVLPKIFSSPVHFKALTRRTTRLSYGAKLLMESFLALGRNCRTFVEDELVGAEADRSDSA